MKNKKKLIDQFLTHKQSLALQELGFDEPCFGWFCKYLYTLFANMYNGNAIEVEGNYPPKPAQLDCYAPTFDQAFDFFAEEFDFHHYIEPIIRNEKVRYEYCIVNSSEDAKEFSEECIVDSRKKAKLACIDLLIKEAKLQQKQ